MHGEFILTDVLEDSRIAPSGSLVPMGNLALRRGVGEEETIMGFILDQRASQRRKSRRVPQCVGMIIPRGNFQADKTTKSRTETVT